MSQELNSEQSEAFKPLVQWVSLELKKAQKDSNLIDVALRSLPDVATVACLNPKQRVQLFELSGRNPVLLRHMPFDYWPAAQMLDLNDLECLDAMLRIELGDVLSDHYITLLTKLMAKHSE